MELVYLEEIGILNYCEHNYVHNNNATFVHSIADCILLKVKVDTQCQW